MLEGLEHQCAGSFAGNESAAVHVERHRSPRGVFRLRQRPQIAESGKADRRDGLFASSSQGRIRIPMANETIRLAHAVGACRARRDDAEAIALQPVANG